MKCQNIKHQISADAHNCVCFTFVDFLFVGNAQPLYSCTFPSFWYHFHSLWNLTTLKCLNIKYVTTLYTIWLVFFTFWWFLNKRVNAVLLSFINDLLETGEDHTEAVLAFLQILLRFSLTSRVTRSLWGFQKSQQTDRKSSNPIFWDLSTQLICEERKAKATQWDWI